MYLRRIDGIFTHHPCTAAGPWWSCRSLDWCRTQLTLDSPWGARSTASPSSPRSGRNRTWCSPRGGERGSSEGSQPPQSKSHCQLEVRKILVKTYTVCIQMSKNICAKISLTSIVGVFTHVSFLPSKPWTSSCIRIHPLCDHRRSMPNGSRLKMSGIRYEKVRTYAYT